MKELIESSTAYRDEQVASLKAQEEEKAAAKGENGFVFTQPVPSTY